jgi:predicted N-formylglutamate amidohydrolase
MPPSPPLPSLPGLAGGPAERLVTDAFEQLPGRPGAAIALCCEHASHRVPAPWAAAAGDAPALHTHWALDIGARPLVFALAQRLGAPATLARFSRLVIDANRPLRHPDLIRAEVEGHALSFNQGVDDEDRRQRALQLYLPYHAAVDRMLAEAWPKLLFSVHTYTPLYLGQPRAVQLGVLTDAHEPLAERFAGLLAPLGLDTRINEPWSGKLGLAYSPERHARAHGIPCLELEVRDDLLRADAQIEALADGLADALRTLVAGLP